jgi:beta-galactosidase
MVQVENEYAMQGDDAGYLKAIADLWREAGIEGPFAVSEGWKDLQRRKAYLPGAALGLDGPSVAELRAGHAVAQDAPVWVGEGYPGWLTHWGESAFARRDFSETLAEVIRAGYSFNLYVVHGGTNFGLTAGANVEDDGSAFQPVITSYDYGAPIDEQGRPTPAFHRLRDLIGREAGVRPPAVPEAVGTGAFAPVTPSMAGTVWQGLGAGRVLPRPGANEVLFGQDQGMVLYRLKVSRAGTLRLEGVRDYAVVYLDGRELAHVSRVVHPALSSSPDVHVPAPGIVEVLVDTFGHINFGPRVGDHKGLVGPVTFDGAPIEDVEAWPLPLDGVWRAPASPPAAPSRGGVWFEGDLALHRRGDVYLDMGAWSKGYVWVNDRLLGRYWHIGPQQRLYCPGAWLQPGRNIVRVLDLHRSTGAPILCAERLHDDMA